MKKAIKAKVVVIGGGFGGIEVAKGLKDSYVEVLLLDRNNHHTFQPLLYQVATAALSPSDITYPIRSILRTQKNATTLMTEVVGVDKTAKTVTTADGQVYEYEFLVLACGARHSYFGKPEWEAFAPGLKSIPDALEIRRRFLTAFEEAEKATDPAERDAWMTFAIVGGGPTGCELAGVLPEIAHKSLRNDFRNIDTLKTRVVLIENSPRPLNVPCDRAGRILVEPDLSVPGYPEIFVIGDMAAAAWGEGKFVPGVAQGAVQGGAHVARMIRKRLSNADPEPFVYKDLGNLAVLGRGAAVADIQGRHFVGLFAWLIWLFIHVLKLVGYRNRLSVLLQWAYNYATFQRGVRLIPGSRGK